MEEWIKRIYGLILHRFYRVGLLETYMFYGIIVNEKIKYQLGLPEFNTDTENYSIQDFINMKHDEDLNAEVG
jgi:hypothetical protein